MVRSRVSLQDLKGPIDRRKVGENQPNGCSDGLVSRWVGVQVYSARISLEPKRMRKEKKGEPMGTMLFDIFTSVSNK